jgi:hypothetical protein
MKIGRFLYIWCLLIWAILLVSSLQHARSVYQYIAPLDLSRWIHFLAYAAVVALPIAAWVRKKSILLSFIAPILSIAIEATQAGIPLPALRMQTIPADLFGIGAGILLGLNIRMMHRSTRQPITSDLESSRSSAF